MKNRTNLLRILVLAMLWAPHVPANAAPAPQSPTGTLVNYEDLFSAKKAQEAARRRIAALGLTEIDHGDGTYSYGLPSSVATPPNRTEQGVTWRYDGQERFAYEFEERRPVNVAAGADATPGTRDTHTQLIGSLAVDEYGRRWVAVDVQADGVKAALAAYDAAVAARFGLEPDHGGATSNPAQARAPEEAGTYTPHTWYSTNCDSDSEKEIRRWNSDNRDLSATPMTDRQEKSVLVLLSADNSTFACSGTMVDDEWLLTAAHCVTRPNGNWYNKLERPRVHP
ncbi:MAG: trypsin-like serine protease [Pseudomonadota bacterium]